MKVTKRILAVVCVTSFSAVLMFGCNKGMEGGAKAFQSASPEIKKLWDNAAAAMTTNGYAVALLQLSQLRSMPGLSPEQTKVVDATSTSINDQMYDAANKGDPAGKKAIEDMRGAMGR